MLLSIKEKKEIIEGVIKRIINIRKIYAPNLLLLWIAPAILPIIKKNIGINKIIQKRIIVT